MRPACWVTMNNHYNVFKECHRVFFSCIALPVRRICCTWTSANLPKVTSSQHSQFICHEWSLLRVSAWLWCILANEGFLVQVWLVFRHVHATCLAMGTTAPYIYGTEGGSKVWIIPFLLDSVDSVTSSTVQFRLNARFHYVVVWEGQNDNIIRVPLLWNTQEGAYSRCGDCHGKFLLLTGLLVAVGWILCLIKVLQRGVSFPPFCRWRRKGWCPAPAPSSCRVRLTIHRWTVWAEPRKHPVTSMVHGCVCWYHTIPYPFLARRKIVSKEEEDLLRLFLGIFYSQE